MSFLNTFNNMLFGNNFNGGYQSRNNNRFCQYRPMYKQVPIEQAKDMILNNKINLIDVRSKNEYDMVKIKNSINIPIDIFEKTIINVIPNKNENIMIYCANGDRSKTAVKILNRLGYNNVYIWEYAALATFPFKDMLIYGNQEK